jgi:hypothetical protein
LKKLGVTFAATMMLAVMLASTAQAEIVSTTGGIVKIPPPPSTLFGALENDTTIWAFDEKQNVTLDRNVSVDISQAGEYDDNDDLTPATIPAGTLVSSHMVHGDNVGSGGGPHHITGTVVTDRPIIGINVMNPNLENSDFLGAPGTIYPTADMRQFNLETADLLVWQIDNHTVFIRMRLIAHVDQIRIITEGEPERVAPHVTSQVLDSNGTDVTNQTVPAGTVVRDKAIVSASGPTPTGTVDFYRFDNGNCSGAPVSVETGVPLAADGTALSSPHTAIATLCYRVHYNGDANYLEADGPIEPLFVETTGGEGCTPGYWKQSHHFDSWIGLSPSDSFEATFGRDAFSGSPSLLDALKFTGGGLKQLSRQATAALLNSLQPDVDYKYTSTQVIAKWQAAFDSGVYEPTKDKFDDANNGGCGLN